MDWQFVLSLAFGFFKKSVGNLFEAFVVKVNAEVFHGSLGTITNKLKWKKACAFCCR
jgi:hypothetical protein